MKRKIKDRFVIPLDGDDEIKFKTRSGLCLAIGFSRVVIGGRGPYIEFEDSHMQMDNIYVPLDQYYRLKNDFLYYDEWRSLCNEDVKIYHQKNTVSYADYRINMWYVSPDLLIMEDGQELMLPLYESGDLELL